MYVNTKCEQVGPSFPNPRPGYEVDNSRVKLHQPRSEAAFQKMMNKTMASNSRYDSFFFSFLIGYRCTIITSSRLIFVFSKESFKCRGTLHRDIVLYVVCTARANIRT